MLGWQNEFMHGHNIIMFVCLSGTGSGAERREKRPSSPNDRQFPQARTLSRTTAIVYSLL
eukprot:scaffold18516_cov91-Skeletonema_dohrnii-CCMP3373.AAC.1